MSTLRKLASAFCLLVLLDGNTFAKPITPYRSGDWAKLIQQTKGRPAIIHIWGFSCGPCVAELPAWGRFAQAQPKLKLILLEVDQVPEDMTAKTLIDAKLSEADNHVSVDYFDEYMRYEIDPKWQGELPITLLIDAQGNTRKLRGSVDFKIVNDWVSKTKKDD